MYTQNVGLGRWDAISVYGSGNFEPNSLLYRFDGNSLASGAPSAIGTQSTTLGVHLRATAADGEFGFLAEISALPAGPIASKFQIRMFAYFKKLKI